MCWGTSQLAPKHRPMSVREETMDAWSTFEQKMCRFLLLISGLTLAFMFFFTLTDVVMRAFGKPIVGDFEIISFLGAVVIGFAIPYTTLLKGHVTRRFLDREAAEECEGWDAGCHTDPRHSALPLDRLELCRHEP